MTNSRFWRNCFIILFTVILIASIFTWHEEVNLSDLEAFDKPSSYSSQSLPSTSSKSQVYTRSMKNETLRAILGSSTWTLLHTMAARYPSDPSIQMQLDYLQFLTLLSKMYPCGQCARHFQEMLKQYPPKLASQKEFAEYLCFLHNKVNDRLKKPQFDCSRLDDRWDCGCGIDS